ncbi:hypothetical protein DPO80_16425 [Salmonella enterica subsp. salamae]|nr:hypothetical protein [Salmonella enterica subsp. salamae]
MFVNKKKYELVLARYEQAASRADLLDLQLAELNQAVAQNGGPYKCILECRETAVAISTPGSEQMSLTLDRLAFVDRWLSSLLPALTRQMSARERLMWEEMLEIHSAQSAYGMAPRQPQGEKQ